jgi:hypothetical protein
MLLENRSFDHHDTKRDSNCKSERQAQGAEAGKAPTFAPVLQAMPSSSVFVLTKDHELCSLELLRVLTMTGAFLQKNMIHAYISKREYQKRGMAPDKSGLKVLLMKHPTALSLRHVPLDILY